MRDTIEPVVRAADEAEPGSVAVLTSPRRVRLVMSGQMDASMNPDLAEAVHEVAQYGLPVDVDTRTVIFMDSTVIALMAYLANRLSARVRFIEPPEFLRFLLDVTQIGDLVDVLDDEPAFPTSPLEYPPPRDAAQ